MHVNRFTESVWVCKSDWSFMNDEEDARWLCVVVCDDDDDDDERNEMTSNIAS